MKQLASPMRLAAATLVTFATLAAASAGSAAVVNNAQDDEFQWSGSIAAGDAIEIKAANGPLRAEIALGNTVEVWATKEGPANDRAEVDIEVVEHDGGVTICTIYPSSWGGDNSCEPGSEGRISSNRNKDQGLLYRARAGRSSLRWHHDERDRERRRSSERRRSDHDKRRD